MSATKKSTTKSAAAKKGSAKAAASHPSWYEMIKVSTLGDLSRHYPASLSSFLFLCHYLYATQTSFTTSTLLAALWD